MRPTLRQSQIYPKVQKVSIYAREFSVLKPSYLPLQHIKESLQGKSHNKEVESTKKTTTQEKLTSNSTQNLPQRYQNN